MSKNTPKPSRSRTQWQPNLLISTDSRQLSNNQLYEPINPQSPRRAAEGAAVTRQMLEISLTAMEDGMARMKVFCPLNNEKAPFLKILNDVVESSFIQFSLGRCADPSFPWFAVIGKNFERTSCWNVEDLDWFDLKSDRGQRRSCRISQIWCVEI